MYSADITLNGETIPKIGVRKRNHCGSENKVRPGLAVKFDQFVKNQKFLGSSSLMLNNSWQDPSLVRQCLAFYILAKLGQPYSLCNFAQVYVNQLSPVTYINVEGIKKPYLARNFPDQKVSTFEGAVSGADLTDEGLKNIEEKDEGAGIDIIGNIIEAIHTNGETLEKYVDIDQFVGFWAAELILSHWDGYVHSKNNFYMIKTAKDNKLKFVVAGTDQIFTAPFTGSIETYSQAFVPQKLLTNPETRVKLKAELKKGLSNLSAEVLKDYIQKLNQVLNPHLSASLRQQTEDEASKLIKNVTTHLKALQQAADQL
jgi:spore coat protein CotH